MAASNLSVLPALPCSRCGKQLIPTAGSRKRANSFTDCLRRCESCQIGYSNAMQDPTTIYCNPFDNIPSQVRCNLKEVLAQSLNVRKRNRKRVEIGFSTSEDAVTWTLFSYLALHETGAFERLGRRWLGVPVKPPTVLFWGVPVPQARKGYKIRDRLISILDRIGEASTRRSEPDIVIDYDRCGLIFIEVKLNSKNDSSTDLNKMERYIAGNPAFVDSAKVKLVGYTSSLGTGVSGGTSRQVDRLGSSISDRKLFSLALDNSTIFESGLARSPGARLLREAWEDLLGEIDTAIGGMPPSLADWLAERQLSSDPIISAPSERPCSPVAARPLSIPARGFM